jgi:hypothetical protein
MPREPTTVDAYVIETLLPDLVGHDARPSAFIVYLYLWAHCAASGSGTVTASYPHIAEETGLSPRAVQMAVRHLVTRRLLATTRSTSTTTTTYRVLRPWLRRR